jgi:hypothetical protein
MTPEELNKLVEDRVFEICKALKISFIPEPIWIDALISVIAPLFPSLQKP